LWWFLNSQQEKLSFHAAKAPCHTHVFRAATSRRNCAAAHTVGRLAGGPGAEDLVLGSCLRHYCCKFKVLSSNKSSSTDCKNEEWKLVRRENERRHELYAKILGSSLILGSRTPNTFTPTVTREV
jgi:hypothetical protein